MPNALIDEKSPYLQQHAHNPVDWIPWGDAAFDKARRENKPVFLSIGYSTCHWCHVMERESFENERNAALLNENFVWIKVDREERPDVDRIYMLFVQATTGSGGWPMSVWLTPDRKPFFGGTYFPARCPLWPRQAFLTFLPSRARLARTTATNSSRAGNRVTEQLRNYISSVRRSRRARLGTFSFAHCSHCGASFDAQFGGFGCAPKFPRPVYAQFFAARLRRDRE